MFWIKTNSRDLTKRNDHLSPAEVDVAPAVLKKNCFWQYRQHLPGLQLPKHAQHCSDVCVDYQKMKVEDLHGQKHEVTHLWHSLQNQMLRRRWSKCNHLSYPISLYMASFHSRIPVQKKLNKNNCRIIIIILNIILHYFCQNMIIILVWNPTL